MNDVATANELVVIEPANALTVFTAPNAIDPLLNRIRQEIDGFSADVSTASGRKAIASMAHRVSRAKTYMDNAGKALVDHHKEIPKKIDATRKRMRDTLDAWRDEVRAPLNAWEQDEEDRINAHKDALGRLHDAARLTAERSADELTRALDWLKTVIVDDSCEEFRGQYAEAKGAALSNLSDALATRQRHDAEQAELARLRAEAAERERKEREERIAQEAADKARRDAEAKAEAERKAAEDAVRREREAAEKRELALKLEAEQAQRRAAEAEEKARRDEQQRREKEQRAAEARETNKRHVAKINATAVADLVAAGIYRETAETVISLVAAKQVSGVSISY